jgi:hypothetical protein
VANNKLQYIRKRDRTVILATVLYISCPSVLFAGDFAYGLGYSSEYSSNITRVPVNEQKEWINSVMAGFGYTENVPNLVARVLSQVEYRHYNNNVFDNETLFNLDSSAVWTVSPQRFTWSVADVYRQLLTGVTVAETPTTRENVNVFTTGPDFFVHVSPVQTLVFGARYGSVYTSHDNTDNDRTLGYTRWQYQSTPRTILSLNYEVLDVTYKDNVANNDYVQQDIYFSARTRPSRSEYMLELGATNISMDRNSDLHEGRARLSWMREFNPESSAGASYSAEFSNTGNDVLARSAAAAGPSPVPAVAPGAVTSDIYYVRRGQVFYARHGSRLGAMLQIFGQNLDYEATPYDNRQTGGNLELAYYYSETFTAVLFSDYVRTRYSELSRRDTDMDSGMRFSHRAGRNILVGLEARRTERTSTDPTAPYTDNRVLFTVLYSGGPAFRTLSVR